MLAHVRAGKKSEKIRGTAIRCEGWVKMSTGGAYLCPNQNLPACFIPPFIWSLPFW
jgi:hypothetical protein